MHNYSIFTEFYTLFFVVGGLNWLRFPFLSQMDRHVQNLLVKRFGYVNFQISCSISIDMRIN